MRCEKCGFTNSPTAKFCKQCGTRQLDVLEPASIPVTDNPRPLDTPVSVSADELCPQCATPRVQDKRFCRQCRFDFNALPAAAVASAPLPAHASPMNIEPAIDSAADARGTSGSRWWLIGGVAVLVAGFAATAGYLLYERHAMSASPQSVVIAASDTTQASAVSPQPVSAAAMTLLTSATTAATSATTAVTSASVTSATEVAPEAPPAAALASASAGAPILNATPSIGPEINNDSENNALRAAIAGNLANGNRCFAARKYDCALSHANAALRLDPQNEPAASLLKRTKAILSLPPYNRVFPH